MPRRDGHRRAQHLRDEELRDLHRSHRARARLLQRGPLMRTPIVFAALLSCAACSHVHSFNQDTILEGRGRYIEVTGQKTVWFNFNFDNTFIDDAYERFVAECPNGQISGTSSRLSSENSFLHWFSRVHFTGYCQDSPPPAPPPEEPPAEDPSGRESAPSEEENDSAPSPSANPS